MARKLVEDKIIRLKTLRKKGVPLKKIAKIVNISSATVSKYIYGIKNGSRYDKQRACLRKRDFTPSQYYDYLAKKHGYESYHYYRQIFFEENGISEKEYREKLAIRNNFPSYLAYIRNRDEIRKRRPLNVYLSELIKERINNLGKTKSGLAREIGVARNTIMRYCAGKCIPRLDKQKDLFVALELPYTNLEDLSEDIDPPGINIKNLLIGKLR